MSTVRRRGPGWRSSLLRHFSPELAAVSRLTVVGDPDRLMTEQGVLEEIQAAGFELIPFEDEVAFRYAYESRYREAWDRGEPTNLVVVLHSTNDDVGNLPYDLLQQARCTGRVLTFSIADLFPHLAPGVVAELDRSAFEALHRAQEAFQPGSLGDTATKDFILRHVFEIAAELIKTPADLLRTLLRRHYRLATIPPTFDARLIAILEKTGEFDGWPLREIVPHRERFLAFLQERWPIFLAKESAAHGEMVAEAGEPYVLGMQGPANLPFGHSDIKVYLDNLFLEGLLVPISGVSLARFEGTWLAAGIEGSSASGDMQRFVRLSKLIQEGIPAPDASAAEWLDTAVRVGEWSALRWTLPKDALETCGVEYRELEERVSGCFEGWVMASYASLHNLPHLPRPVILHNVAKLIAHGWGKARRRVALVVVDGLSMSEWALLRRSLAAAPGNRTISDGAVFAWVPTITSVSRQSIFAAEPPFYFGASIGTTSKEEQHWRRFWEDKGVLRGEIGYTCQMSQEPDEGYLERITEVAERPSCRVLGIVVGRLDEMLHGEANGSNGLHMQVKHWAESGHFNALVVGLNGLGFEVFVTADHGNTEAIGFGKPNVGAVANERGARAHVFTDDLTRANTAKGFPGTISWPNIGLPENYKPLLAPRGKAFIAAGKRTVSHGGISLDELIVPFVKVVSS